MDEMSQHDKWMKDIHTRIIDCGEESFFMSGGRYQTQP
jgi:hypothetical protein